MEYFDKAMHYTFMIFFGCLGVLVALCVIKIAIEVVGFMLGSTIGTLILGWIAWRYYKRYRETH